MRRVRHHRHRQHVTIRIGIVAEHPDRHRRPLNHRRRIITSRRRTIQPRHRETHRGRGRSTRRIGHRIGERIWPRIPRRGRIGHRTVHIHHRHTMRRVRHHRHRQHVTIRIGIVAEHPDRHRRPLNHRRRIITSRRRTILAHLVGPPDGGNRLSTAHRETDLVDAEHAARQTQGHDASTIGEGERQLEVSAGDDDVDPGTRHRTAIPVRHRGIDARLEPEDLLLCRGTGHDASHGGDRRLTEPARVAVGVEVIESIDGDSERCRCRWSAWVPSKPAPALPRNPKCQSPGIGRPGSPSHRGSPVRPTRPTPRR